MASGSPTHAGLTGLDRPAHMGDKGPIDPLLDNIYEAAADGTRWPVVLKALSAQFGSSSAHLSFENVQSTHGRMISFGTDPGFGERYGDYFVTRNVLWRELVRRRLSHVVSDQEVMPKDTLRKSEFYNGFLAPQDCDHVLIAPIIQGAEAGSTITLWRPRRREAWTRKDISRFQGLVPHLSRAIRVGNCFDPVRSINAFSTEALYRLGRGLFVVTSSATILFANAIAEDLLVEGSAFHLHERRLSTRQPEENHVLHRLITTAAEQKSGGNLIVTRGEITSLLITVLPIQMERWHSFNGAASALVLTKDLAHVAQVGLDAFSRHYRFTAAERRVAQELLVGDGIAAVAGRLKIAEATAHTHRIRIFQKTGVRRQAELVRVILEWTDGPSRHI